MLEIKVPVVGESVVDGVLTTWFKEEGDAVQLDEPLFELETDKITMTVPAEGSGRLHILTPAGSKVKIGQRVGELDAAAQAAGAGGLGRLETAPGIGPLPVPPAASAPAASAPRVDDGPPITPHAGLPQAAAKLAAAASLEELSPAVRRLVEEHRLDPGQIAPSGKAGRLTKEDVVRFLDRTPLPGPAAHVPEPEPATAAGAPRLAAISGSAAPRVPIPATVPRDPAARQTRRTMSTLRQRVAERLVLAQQTAAILTTFNEADMTAVLDWRERHKELFQKRYNVKLGFMSFFVKAAVDALRRVPMLNSQIQGDEIVENHFYDIGVAVGTEQGLVVPVIRDCDRLSFAELELAIAAQARRAREKKLQLSDLSGGTFTISNGGVYGSLLSTPILNPPQSGILGMHSIKKRPVAVGEQVAVRPMMYLALSYDHRLVDGEQAVTFLRRIVECIESPERMLLEV